MAGALESQLADAVAMARAAGHDAALPLNQTAVIHRPVVDCLGVLLARTAVASRVGCLDPYYFLRFG